MVNRPTRSSTGGSDERRPNASRSGYPRAVTHTRTSLCSVGSEWDRGIGSTHPSAVSCQVQRVTIRRLVHFTRERGPGWVWWGCLALTPMSVMPSAVLNLFPYLPLQNEVAVGSYRLVPVHEFAGPWLDAQFEDVARKFIAAFVDPDRKPLKIGAVLIDGTWGCDGVLPDVSDRHALQRAVELAALDSNPNWSRGAQGWNVVTSDNAELHSWPIDRETGAMALTSGFVARIMRGGQQIEDGFIVPPPEELHLPMGTIVLDSGVLDAAYRHFLPSDDPEDDRARRRLRDAIGWLSKAWRNTPSINWPDRIVLLKTGFEALTGRSATHEAASWLREMFERVVDADSLSHGLLWSRTESMRTFVDPKGVPRQCTDLEHWFRSFGEVRNSIIHGDGSPRTLEYDEVGSAYVGQYFHIAERLLREAIKVSLTDRGEPLLYEPMQVRRIAAYLAAGTGG